MKNVFSLIACLIISIVTFQYRLAYSDLTKGEPPLKITEWDAFGYYIYLPSFFIYHDYKQLSWVPAIDTKYKVTGGNGVQAQKADNGNYAFKYLGGVAIMELPFFLIAHVVAKETGYPPDGFSPPYQYIVSFGIILYCILDIFLLRHILLRYSAMPQQLLHCLPYALLPILLTMPLLRTAKAMRLSFSYMYW